MLLVTGAGSIGHLLSCDSDLELVKLNALMSPFCTSHG